MPSAERTVTIRRPADQVFAYLADGTNDPQWRSGVLEIERTSDADGVGAVYRQVLAGPGGRRIAGDYRITVFDPPRRLEFQVIAGPARSGGLRPDADVQPEIHGSRPGSPSCATTVRRST